MRHRARGVGLRGATATTPVDDLTFETLRDDAAAAVDLIAGRDDIDALVLPASPAADVPDLLDVQAEKFADLVAHAGQQSNAAQGAVQDLQDLASQVREIGEGRVKARRSRVRAARSGRPPSRPPVRHRIRWRPAMSPSSPSVVSWTGTCPPHTCRPGPTRSATGVRSSSSRTSRTCLTRLETGDVAAPGPGDVGEELDPSVVEAIVAWLSATL